MVQWQYDLEGLSENIQHMQTKQTQQLAKRHPIRVKQRFNSGFPSDSNRRTGLEQPTVV